MLKNPSACYGLIARGFHWTLAVLLTALFALGLYMTGLTYYDPWYQDAFNLHRSFGILALALAILRILWVLFRPAPPLVATLKPWERKAAHAVHGLLYAMTLGIPVSGYLISTADGRPVDVFGWFALPALLPPMEGMEEIAGRIHALLAYTTAGLVLVHSLAALKHHFLDKDDTLRKMLGSSSGAGKP
jgi:cytochrome b561